MHTFFVRLLFFSFIDMNDRGEKTRDDPTKKKKRNRKGTTKREKRLDEGEKGGGPSIYIIYI